MKYAVLDIETTGLDPQSDQILEIGIIIIDEDLKELGRAHDVFRFDVFCCGREVPPAVLKMHADNGLWFESRAADRTITNPPAGGFAFEALCKEHGPGLVMAGNSIHFDRAFLKAQVPAFLDNFHYRMFDIGALARELREVLAPLGISVPGPSGEVPHRGLLDAEQELADWRTLRAFVKALRPA